MPRCIMLPALLPVMLATRVDSGERMPPKPSQPADPSGREAIRAFTFEQAVAELESIIDRIESGEIGLEESLKAYERGILLRDHCREILGRTEQRVAELNPAESAKDRAQSG